MDTLEQVVLFLGKTGRVILYDKVQWVIGRLTPEDHFIMESAGESWKEAFKNHQERGRN